MPSLTHGRVDRSLDAMTTDDDVMVMKTLTLLDRDTPIARIEPSTAGPLDVHRSRTPVTAYLDTSVLLRLVPRAQGH